MAFISKLKQDDRVYFPIFLPMFLLEGKTFASFVQDCDKFWDLNYKEQCNGPCTLWWGEDLDVSCVMGWVDGLGFAEDETILSIRCAHFGC